MNQIVKNALYSNIEESLNRIISDADDFQNLTNSFLSADKLHLWWNLYDDPIGSSFVRLLTDRQANKQTNAEQKIPSFAEVNILIVHHCCVNNVQKTLDSL